MTTNIRVNVVGDNLVKTAQDNQQANRNSLLQKEADNKFLADVRRIKGAAAKEAQAAVNRNEGGVLEYGIEEETIATRDNPLGFGVGWMYETYASTFEHQWTDSERFRVAVGSGDGSQWKYVEIELPKPTLSGYQLTLDGYRRTGDVLVDIITFTTNTGEPRGSYPICDERSCNNTINWDVYRYARFFEYYRVNRNHVRFILPVADKVAIVAGCAYLTTHTERSYGAVPSQTVEQYPPTYTAYNFQDSRFIRTPSDENTCYCIYEMPYSTNTSFGQFYDGRETLSWVYKYGDQDNPKPFNPPDYIFTSQNVVRINYAFLVSDTVCKQIEVPFKLEQVLNERFPTPEWELLSSDPLFGQYYGWSGTDEWNFTGKDYGLGIGYLEEQNWGGILFSSPGIFDIIGAPLNNPSSPSPNDYAHTFDFDLFDNQKPALSRFGRKIPIVGPDFTTGRLAQPPETQTPEFVQSAFYVDTYLEKDTVVSIPGPDIPYGQGDYYAYHLPAYISSYIYLPTNKRELSSYYLSSLHQTTLDYVGDTPEYYAFYKTGNSNGLTLKRNEDLGLFYPESNFPTWLPEGTYKTNGSVVKLSTNRLLPPAIFNDADTEHPLINPQIVPTVHIGTGGSGRLNAPYSNYPFTTLFWTNWGKNWRAVLSRLGFSAGDMRP